jgi:hypothetical protein
MPATCSPSPDVNAVNPVSKADLGFLKQFTVVSYSANSAGVLAGHDLDRRVPERRGDGGRDRPQRQGDHQRCHGGDGYRQNLVFHKNAFALAMVPMVKPPGAGSGAGVAQRRQRPPDPDLRRHERPIELPLDCLYGVKAIDPRLATRLSGTA